MKKKQALTLLEIMIVIVLIGLIGSVLGFSMKGSLDKGKIFKTERAIQLIEDTLMLEVAKGASITDVVAQAETYLRNSGVVKNAPNLLIDGWGVPFVIEIQDDQIVVTSERLTQLQAPHDDSSQRSQE
ncbi:MAG: type II secretion system GspH family protein [Chlamydiales bacterium]|jgi:prepilin-type N-terminal cleavage/methylation domain-containing protein|nr:type II secretion system GspH family protein [Chlamydiales bacterium]